MNIKIDVFVFAHGHRPRGHRQWDFITPEGQQAWAPGPMTLTEAKAWLRREVRAMGLSARRATWYVAP